MPVAVKRVYESVSRSDGARVLVDRLWPRGLSKTEIHLQEWLRDLAPSDDLRKWYHAQPERWLLFRKRYLKELSRPEAEKDLQKLYSPGPQEKTSHAPVCLEERDAQQRNRAERPARRNAQTADWHRSRRASHHAHAGCGSAAPVTETIAVPISVPLSFRICRMRAVFQWSLGTRTLELGKRTLIMGVVNVTPDSFSDGGLLSRV